MTIELQPAAVSNRAAPRPINLIYIGQLCKSSEISHRASNDHTTEKRAGMAICTSVNTHWKTSAAVEMAMLMLVTVIMSAVTTSALPAAHHGRLRVSRPCSGRHAESIDLPSTSNTDRINVSHHQLRRAVRSVSNLLAALYDDVNRLKADYVRMCAV